MYYLEGLAEVALEGGRRVLGDQEQHLADTDTHKRKEVISEHGIDEEVDREGRFDSGIERLRL